MCEQKITVSQSVLDFLTGIHTKRDNPQQRATDSLRHAFNHAYRDMSNHTIAYAENAKCFFNGDSKEQNENKKELKECVFDYLCDGFGLSNDGIRDAEKLVQLLGGSEDTFNDWHKSVCDRLTSFHDEKHLIILNDNEGMALGEIICHVDNMQVCERRAYR